MAQCHFQENLEMTEAIECQWTPGNLSLSWDYWQVGENMLVSLDNGNKVTVQFKNL